MIGGIGFGLATALGIAAGGGVILLNLLWVAALVKELLKGQASGKKFGLKVALKSVALYGVIVVLIALKLVDAIGFLIGISGLAPSVLAAGIRYQFRQPKQSSP